MIDHISSIVFNYFEAVDLLISNNDQKLAEKVEGLKYIRKIILDGN
jgi:hypothetical protein